MFKTPTDPSIYTNASSRQTSTDLACSIQDHDHKYLHYFNQQSANFTSRICQGTPHLRIYAYPRPLYTWGLGLIDPNVPSPVATIRYLSQQSINNINGGISTIQVYWSSSGQLLSRTHHLSIWKSSQNYKQQIELYPLKYCYIKLWQSHAPFSKPW